MTSLISYVDAARGLSVPTMVINLVDPLVDAGGVAQALQAVVDSLESSTLATFDEDLIYDFRAQRPIVSYEDGKLVDMAAPRMSVDIVTDMHGENFLYVNGQEPDFRWNTLTSDLLDVVKRFGVREVFSFAGIPAGIPHTRPADMLIRATTRTDVQYVSGRADQFSQLQDFFEYCAGEQGISVTNLRVRVPFYMVKGPHPFISGALALIKMTADLGGPTLPFGDLEQLEDRQLRDLSELVQEGSDFSQLLAHLEEEYDKLPSDAGLSRPNNTLPPMPSAEEIARAAEQFLAGIAHDPLHDAGLKNHSLGGASLGGGSLSDHSLTGACAEDRSEMHKRGGLHMAEPDKRKDGQEADITSDSKPRISVRSFLSRRLRRGKHHKLPGE